MIYELVGKIIISLVLLPFLFISVVLILMLIKADESVVLAYGIPLFIWYILLKVIWGF